MPPWASMYLKYASAPQLSDSPIWAYTPESASSPQATMVELLLAEPPPPPPPPLHAASAPASKAAPAAAAILNVTRLRIIVLPFWNVLLTTGPFLSMSFQLPTSSELTTGEERKSAGPPSKTRDR